MMRTGLLILLTSTAAAWSVASASTVDEAAWLKVDSDLAQPRLEAERLAIDEHRLATLEEQNASYTDLLVRFDIHLKSDGSVQERVTEVRQFLGGSEGQGREVFFWVMPSFETARIRLAYVRIDGSHRIPVDRHTIQIMPSNERRLFSDVRRVVVPLPGIRPGAIAVLDYESSFRASEWPTPWGRRFLLASSAPSERYEFRIHWEVGVESPAWQTDHDRLVCEARQREIECVLDQPDVIPMDGDLSAVYDVFPQLAIAKQQTWQQVARVVGDIVEHQLQQPTELDIPAGLLLGRGSDVEKWARLYRFVADEVRYLGLEHQTSAVVPKPPSVTLQDRYGDCKDKATLLLALARMAGIDAYPVLISTQRRNPTGLLLPQAGYFDHMIVCRDTQGGALDCVDPTISHLPYSESWFPVSGRSRLDLRDSTRSAARMPTARHGWTIEIEGEIEVDCEGRMNGRLTRRMSGLAALYYRAGLAGVSSEDADLALTQEYSNATGRSWKPDFDIDGLHEPSVALSITHELEPRMVLGDDSVVADEAPWLVFHGLGMRSENRRLPFGNPGAMIRSTRRYQLCGGVVPDLVGARLDLRSEFGILSREYSREPSGVVVTSAMDVPASMVPPERIEAFNQFVKGALDQTEIWFSVRTR